MASKPTVAIFNGRIMRLLEQNNRKTPGEGRILGDSWKNNRVNCPSCGAAMTALNVDGHSGAVITVDLCDTCQAFWFDAYESLQLSPGSTLKLFTRIGELATGAKPTISPVLKCPRCQSRLLPTHDRQRDTPFEYWRCDQRHGRFITSFNFLREKSFIKTLSTSELEELRRNVQTVNCSNCGGAVDVTRGSACPHCRSPLSMVDMKQAQTLVAQLREAAAPKPIDPALPLNLARARREVEESFAAIERNDNWWRDASSSGLVEAGFAALARLLKK
jgi:DNA-directed RNA polymerase subunit RPC12/RpoP